MPSGEQSATVQDHLRNQSLYRTDATRAAQRQANYVAYHEGGGREASYTVYHEGGGREAYDERAQARRVRTFELSSNADKKFTRPLTADGISSNLADAVRRGRADLELATINRAVTYVGVSMLR